MHVAWIPCMPLLPHAAGLRLCGALGGSTAGIPNWGPTQPIFPRNLQQLALHTSFQSRARLAPSAQVATDGFTGLGSIPSNAIRHTKAWTHGRSWCDSDIASSQQRATWPPVSIGRLKGAANNLRDCRSSPLGSVQSLQHAPSPSTSRVSVVQHTASQVSRLCRHPHIATGAAPGDIMIGAQRSARLGLCGLAPTPSPVRSRAAVLR